MNLRNLTARLMILCLFHLSVVSAAAEVQGGSAPAGLQRRVEQFGVGTDLVIKLRTGEKLRGSVDSIGGDSFVVTSNKDGTSRQIAFHDLQSVRYPKRGYKAEGRPDAAAAKRMVVQLGVGEHIMVQVSPTEKIRGHIVQIQEDHFVIRPDGQTRTVDVPYSAIWKVNRNLSFGATLAIVTGIAAAAVLILVLSGEEDINVLPD